VISASIGGTPLVALQRVIARAGAPVLAKCEHLNPGGSVKDRIALAIVEDARAHGRLRDGATIVEATAGNTGLGLALVAAATGHRLVCVMPEKMSQAKRAALSAVGAELVITPNLPPSDPRNFQRVAERLAEENGWFLADQFRNPANPAVHERTTAAEIWAQTGGRIGAFVAGAGTGGTITGVGRFLKARGSTARVVLADPVGSGLAQWVRTGELGPDAPYAVEGIGSSEPPANLDRRVIDEAISVSDADSFAAARRLIAEEGLFVGGSAGTAVAAALQLAARGDIHDPIVALLPDSWDRYLGCAWLTAPVEAPQPTGS
jgi:cysteine synthase